MTMITEERLREIEDWVQKYGSDPRSDAWLRELVAEVRRLRGLFSEDDAERCEAAVSAISAEGLRDEDDTMDGLEDLARRIREAIGHPPTDNET